MNDQQRPQGALFKSLIIIVILQLIAVIHLGIRTHTLNNDLNKTKSLLSAQNASQAEAVQKLQTEQDTQKSLLSPVVSAKENLVIFPELKIALPYNDITKTLQYTYDNGTDGGKQNARITSTLLNDHKLRQLSCSELVRVNTEDGTPYSPWEDQAVTVDLPDERKLYIIAVKAFKNNEGSTEECASEVWTRLTPQQVAEEFKKAQAY